MAPNAAGPTPPVRGSQADIIVRNIDDPSRDALESMQATNQAPWFPSPRRARRSPPPSLTICICHGIARATIEAAISAGAKNPNAVGAATRAGTGCGSCRPEIAALCPALPVPEPA